jgi:segregation and condensation protein A
MDVKLETYEGPLHLLLRLIERAEINIHDIPIAELTEQYLEAIKDLPADMENISDFIVMAATLLEIKSRMLLPKPPQPETDEDDPRDALVRRLLEVKHCRDIAAELQRFPAPGQRLVRAGEAGLVSRYAVPVPGAVLTDVEIDSLWELFSEVMSRREARKDPVRAGYGDMPRERFTVTAAIAGLRGRLQAHGQFKLSDVLEECVNRGEMVVTFLALLEMIRQGLVRVRQDRLFREVWCMGPAA